MIVPYGFAELAAELWTFRRMRPVRMLLRTAIVGALYVAIVQAYVAKYLYLDRSAGQAPRGIGPKRFPEKRP